MGFSGAKWAAIRTEVLGLAETATERAARILLAARDLRGRLAGPDPAEEAAIALGRGC